MMEARSPRVVGLGIAPNKPVRREEALRALVDAFIALVDEPRPFACIRISPKTANIEVCLADDELQLGAGTVRVVEKV